MVAMALVLGQPQMDVTNSVVLYVIGGVVLAWVVWIVWRLYVKSKLAAGYRPDQRRPR